MTGALKENYRQEIQNPYDKVDNLQQHYYNKEVKWKKL